MLEVSYAVSQAVEMLLGAYIFCLMYPEMRWENRLSKGLFAVACGGVCLLYAWNAGISYVSNFSLILSAVFASMIHTVFFRVSFGTSFLWVLAFYTNLTLLKMPVLIGSGIIGNKTLGQVNRGARNVWELIWCVLLDLLVAYWVIKKKNSILTIKLLLTRQRWLFGLVTVMQWILLTYNMWLGELGFETVDLVINIAIIVCAALLLQCLMLYITYSKHRAETEKFDMSQKLIKDYNYELQEFYLQNRQSIHDIRHHMLSIAACLETGNAEKAKLIIEQYLQDLHQTGHEIWTGFPFIDFILNYKKQEMDTRGIGFLLDIEIYESPLEESEMGVVLGNLLDNAIAAAGKCQPENRHIFLSMKTVNQMFLMQLRNSSSQLPKRENGRFITDKENQKAHGLGVENVKRIIEKYDGSIEFKYDNEQFCVTIVM